jgi:hypothetical protein
MMLGHLGTDGQVCTTPPAGPGVSLAGRHALTRSRNLEVSHGLDTK